MSPDYVIRPLTGDVDAASFDCGRPELDTWLQRHAVTAQERGLGRTFVVVATAAPTRVIAYYTLSAHLIEQQSLTRKLGRGLPRQLPVILLGRLAVDHFVQGQGVGGAVLAEAMTRVAKISVDLGARFVVVDAIDPQAAGFYEHYGFTRVPDQQSMRLVQRITSERGYAAWAASMTDEDQAYRRAVRSRRRGGNE